MTAGRSVAVDPHSVRQVARGRAVSGLARAYAVLYRLLYEQASFADAVPVLRGVTARPIELLLRQRHMHPLEQLEQRL